MRFQIIQKSPISLPIKVSATSYRPKWIILTYILSSTVSKLLRIIGQIYAVTSGNYLSSPRCVRGEVELRNLASQSNSLYRMMWKYSNILKRLGVNHECDGRTDGQTVW